ncbi:MAG: AIR synthase family protein [Desulfuromonadales bacterium]
MENSLGVGKVPADLLEKLLARAPVDDPRVLVGPGIGLDCAVVDAGDNLLVFKSDPITFATDEMGNYLVQINANDIATTGASPRWLLATLLLPENRTTADLVEEILEQIYAACRDLEISLIGGHSEITHGLDRPVIVGSLIGDVSRQHLVTPRGASPGDRILLTKGVPIEATAILAREFPDRLSFRLEPEEMEQARNYLSDPGIGVLRDARIAVTAGRVTAMHDPTEGGLSTALWELAQASGRSLLIDPKKVPVPPLAARVLDVFGLDPLAAIASGALLLTVAAEDASDVRHALEAAGITCSDLGVVKEGDAGVWQDTDAGREKLACPEVDEIARAFGEK